MGVVGVGRVIVFMLVSRFSVFSCSTGVGVLDGAGDVETEETEAVAVGYSCEKHRSHSWPEPSM